MSRYYEMTVFVDRYDVAKVEDIQKAAAAEWPFDEWTFCGGPDEAANGMQASGQGQLCGGETEEEFADRLAAPVCAPRILRLIGQCRQTYSS
jgi:hypothetical protein